VDTDFAGMEYSSHEEQEHGHGRSETRSVHTILHPEGIRDQSLWQDLQAITMIVSEQQVAGKEASMEVRYYIGSKAMQAAGYARAIRGHWGIENGLHWVLDMSFAEDQSRIRKEHGPENFALLRRLALSLIKRNRQRGSVRGQRLLLMRYPKLIRANSTRDQLVLNVDMAPTLLDLAGTAAPTDMHGASLLPLLKGDAPKWRTSFLAEYFAPPHNRIPAWQAVRTTQWKYIHYTAVGEMDELYDLAADRYELKNVIHEPGAAGVLKEMRTALERLRNETP
jgi:predicted transposase YbfD/YdcC